MKKDLRSFPVNRIKSDSDNLDEDLSLVKYRGDSMVRYQGVLFSYSLDEEDALFGFLVLVLRFRFGFRMNQCSLLFLFLNDIFIRYDISSIIGFAVEEDMVVFLHLVQLEVCRCCRRHDAWG